MSASTSQRRSGLKSWDKEDMVKAIRAVRNKEVRYLQLPRSVVFPVLRCAIMYTEIPTLLKPCCQNISQALEEKLLVCLLLLERKYFGRTRDDVRRLDFQ
jgi:hypothetical protein